MPTKEKSPFATPKTRNNDADGPVKQDLVGELIVVTLNTYNPEQPTSFGETQAAFCDLVVVTGEHKGQYPGWAAFGLLGKQIGEAIDEGQTAPCRVTSGTSKNGQRTWIGADFDVDEDDTKLALDAYNAAAPAPF